MTFKVRVRLRGLPSLPASVLASVLAAGCAPLPPAAPTDHGTPPAWPSLPVDGAAGGWQPATDATLQQLQQRALQANRDIGQALLRWQAAQRQAGLAGLDRQPQPGLDAHAGGSRPLDGGTLQRSAGLNAVLRYEADLWQRLAQAERAQQALARAAEADWAAARVQVRARVAEAYWSLAALDAQAPRQALMIEGAEQALALTRHRVQEGKLLPIEVDKAASTLQAFRLQAAQQAEQRRLQRLQLGLLLADAQADFAPARLPEAAAADWRASETPPQVLARRPDVQQARAQLDAALARVGAADASRYPRLSFSLGLGSGGPRWSDWLEHPLATLGSTLLVPMVDWRRLDLQRQDALGEQESAALQLREVMHRALVEIEQLAAGQRRLQQEAAALAQRLHEAAAAERVATVRFEAGAIGRLDWLQARTARLAAEQELSQLQLRRLLNDVALQRALVAG